MKDEERIRCPVHNLISFKASNPEDQLLWSLVQTRPVQRLRRIKQLGFSELVYPGASHSRFSHVLGAMQMARRMLHVLGRNQTVNRDDAERPATLAAALLHDIGHGPYSHVFEEISEHFGRVQTHEQYTRDLIETTEIKEVLGRSGVLDRTRQFFGTEPGKSFYDAVISSQLDCDRIDFLCRDRLHTGVRSAALDLEWLFDSLRIEQVPYDDSGTASRYSFVFTEKGRTVAEDFVIAYMKMYENVYFHKTTRGLQHLAKDMLIEVVKECSSEPLVNSLPLIKFFTGSKADLEAYLMLDDSSVVAVAQVAASNSWGKASILANRFLWRDVYKCLELPSTQTGNVARSKMKRFKEALENERIYHVDDVISHRSYKQHSVTDESFLKNILIKTGGEYEALGAVSDFLKGPPKRVARFYFESSEMRDRAATLFRGA